LHETVQTIPTIGFNVETVMYDKTALTIWDVGGCDKIRPLIRHYFQNTQALIFVVDSQDDARLGEATDELWHMLMEDELIQIPILIYLNKIDIHHGLKQDHVVKEMRLVDTCCEIFTYFSIQTHKYGIKCYDNCKREQQY
jgi:small GTP-binding protein